MTIAAIKRGPRVVVPCLAKPTGAGLNRRFPGEGHGTSPGTGARTGGADKESECEGRIRVKAWPHEDPCLMSLNVLVPPLSTRCSMAPVADAARA